MAKCDSALLCNPLPLPPSPPRTTPPPPRPNLPLPLLQINAGLASDNIGLGKACSRDLIRMCTAAAAILLDVRGTFSLPPGLLAPDFFFFFFCERRFDCCHKENCERYSGARSSSSQYSLSPRIHLLSRPPLSEKWGVGGRGVGREEGGGLRDPTRILKYRSLHSGRCNLFFHKDAACWSNNPPPLRKTAKDISKVNKTPR